MKKSYFGLLLAALVTLASCNKEGSEVIKPGAEDDGNSVYLSVAMSMPSGVGTRSGTDNRDENKPDTTPDGQTPSDSDGNGAGAGNDYEVGKDFENTISSMLLVIASSNDEYIMHSYVSTTLTGSVNSSTGSYEANATAKFKRSTLDTEYNTGILKDNKKIHLYAFCNPTQELISFFGSSTDKADFAANVKTGDYQNSAYVESSWLNQVAHLVETSRVVSANSIWNSNQFLMTNAVVVTAELPARIEDWTPYTTEDKPFKLSGDNSVDNNPDNSKNAATSTEYRGPIKVERAAARFDFKDGSPSSTGMGVYEIKGNQNVYTEGSTGAPGTVASEELNLYNVQLTDMSLVNMHNKYYSLRRVSDNGTTDVAGNKWRIGKYEIGGENANYVVDADWNMKNQDASNIGALDNAFNYPLFKNEFIDGREGSYGVDSKIYQYNSSEWDTYKVSAVLGGTYNDNWTSDAGTSQAYKIWRYVTENTIPGANSDRNQKVGYSTGIVFKAKIMPGKTDDLSKEYGTTNSKGEVLHKRFVSAEVENLLNGGASETSPSLYLYNGLLYAGFKDFVKQAHVEGVNSLIYFAADEILGNWSTASADGKDFVHTTTPSAEGVKLTTDILWALTIAEESDFDEAAKETELYTKYFRNKGDYTFAEKTTFFTDAAGTEETTITFKNLAVGKNFTIYQVENNGTSQAPEWGYYCYYFYWNRHNDNGNNALMGPMEFATVRNNVYKLAVTKIGRLGHPTVPENDPDPIEPDDPDEEESVYMSVEVEVLPWVVRVNNIEF